MAEDHIHFTIGRQAASLKQVSEAVKAFEKLLNASSKQSAPQQAAFLREFLHTHNVSTHNDGDNDELSSRHIVYGYNGSVLELLIISGCFAVIVAGERRDLQRTSYFTFAVIR